MNVIIANKSKEMLMSLDIEVLESIEGVFSADTIINKYENFYFNKMILDITAIENYQDLNNLQRLSTRLDMNKIILILDNKPESDSRSYLSKLISMGIYNFTRNVAGITYLMSHPNSYRDVVHIHNLKDTQESITVIEEAPTIISETGEVIIQSQRLNIIGIKSLTIHSGATTLTYLMRNHLEKSYKVIAMEIDKNDFLYFDDKTLLSTTSQDLAKELMKHQDYEVALIDLNNYEDEEICTDVLYLIEPSTIKLNRLMKKSKTTFEKLKGKKIVLVNSLLTKEEVAEFEYESKSKVFFNLPPLNDRSAVLKPINRMLNKMGFTEIEVDSEDNGEKRKFFSVFKSNSGV